MRLPLAVKLLQTAFVCILIPVYGYHLGPAHFLWFSDIALFVSVIALWSENSLLASMQAVAVAALEIVWIVDFAFQLITGQELLGFSAYMFDAERPLILRTLSLFHIWLPVLLLWMVYRLGYDRRALAWQTLAAWIILPLTYLLADPAANVNAVHELGDHHPEWLAGWLYLLGLMLALPLFVYVPSHHVLKRLMPSRSDRGRRVSACVTAAASAPGESPAARRKMHDPGRTS